LHVNDEQGCRLGVNLNFFGNFILRHEDRLFSHNKSPPCNQLLQSNCAATGVDLVEIGQHADAPRTLPAKTNLLRFQCQNFGGQSEKVTSGVA
jgi:hypothetical protein